MPNFISKSQTKTIITPVHILHNNFSAIILKIWSVFVLVKTLSSLFEKIRFVKDVVQKDVFS
jgi:hypothetical protein